jgi:dTDP-4-amino-4,6-dideoxygalactose transaminase
MFYVLLPDLDRRNDVLEAMRKRGVIATFHYLPLHDSDAGRKFRARPTECPVSVDIAARLLRLPFYNNMSERDSERAIDAFLDSVVATQQV